MSEVFYHCFERGKIMRWWWLQVKKRCKNRQWTQQLLETLRETTDIILLQEPPRYLVKRIPSGTHLPSLCLVKDFLSLQRLGLH